MAICGDDVATNISLDLINFYRVTSNKQLIQEYWNSSVVLQKFPQIRYEVVKIFQETHVCLIITDPSSALLPNVVYGRTGIFQTDFVLTPTYPSTPPSLRINLYVSSDTQHLENADVRLWLPAGFGR